MSCIDLWVFPVDAVPMTALQFDYQTLAFGPDLVGLCLLAMAFDVLFGSAPWLRRLFPHPALIMAAFIGGLANKLNRPDRGPTARLVRGLLVELIVIGLAFIVGTAVGYLTNVVPFFWIISLVLLVSLTVLRGPFDEVGRATQGYLAGLAGARKEAAMVIGPAAAKMTEAQLNRAMAEHLAGRYADGLMGGIFWLLLLGWPGFFIWRAINIAGRLLDDARADMSLFGLIATRVNEAVGLLPAVLAALLFAVAAIFVPGANPARAVAAMFGKGISSARHSERAAVATALAALKKPGQEKSMTGPDVIRAQYLYAVASLLAFAFVIVWATIRYAI
jgi:adenosylcobinamide-phosphate synthase